MGHDFSNFPPFVSKLLWLFYRMLSGSRCSLLFMWKWTNNKEWQIKLIMISKKKKKSKTENFESKRKKLIHGTHIRLSADFSAETLHQNSIHIVKVLEEKNCQPRIFSKAVLHKDVPKQTKTKKTNTEGVHHYHTAL